MDTATLWRAAALLALGWLLAWLVAVLATRPLRGGRAARGAEPGEEPPALAGLLASGVRPGGEAVPATVLDLAARGWCGFEWAGPDRTQTVCRLRGPGGTGPLRPYERRVLAHLAARTGGDGLAPASALGEDVAGWRGQFEQEVLEHARGLGMVVPRSAAGVRALFRLATVAPAALVTAALLRAGVREWFLFYGLLGYITWGILNRMVRALMGEQLG